MSWGILDDIPGVAQLKAAYDTADDVAHRRWKSALGNGVDAVSPTSGWYNVGQQHIEGGQDWGNGIVPDAAHGVKVGGQWVHDKIDAPYEEKKKGYDAIRDEIAGLKRERQGQKDFAYNLADSKYEPARQAIKALYGDPASWKL
jgi:hypothetical protein